MSEQQRVFLAVGICLAIIMAWQFLTPAPQPKPRRVEANTTAAAPAPTAAPAIPEPVAAEPQATDVVYATRALSTPLLDLTVSNKPLAFTDVSLRKYREHADGGLPGQVQLAPTGRQAEINWQVGGEHPALDFVEAASGVQLAGTAAEVALTTSLQPRADAYGIDVRVRAENKGAAARAVDAEVVMRLPVPKERGGGLFSAPVGMVGTLCQLGDDTERKNIDKLEKERFEPGADASWAGIDLQYFVVAAVPEKIEGARCIAQVVGDTLELRYVLAGGALAPGATWERQFVLYAGPKRDDDMAKVAPALADVIDYTILGIPLGAVARPMIFILNIFHGWTNSWGVAVMLLTLLVKLVLFPVTWKSAVSMRKVQLLKPELDKLKERFPNDRERQQMEQLKLYKEKGVNPLGGCLPMLLQMPVWFALYRALWTAVDLYQQPFLWLPNLTAKEPGIPFLAISLGGIFFVQQLLTPMGVDNQQAKVMKWVMPIMFPLMMISLPSGLVLYILVNSLLSIVQQLAINKTVGPPQAQPAKVAPGRASAK